MKRKALKNKEISSKTRAPPFETVVVEAAGDRQFNFILVDAANVATIAALSRPPRPPLFLDKKFPEPG